MGHLNSRYPFYYGRSYFPEDTVPTVGALHPSAAELKLVGGNFAVAPQTLVAKHAHLLLGHPLCLEPVRIIYVTFKHFQSPIKNKRLDKHMHDWRLKEERAK